MTADLRDLLLKARSSIQAAELLLANGFPNYAVSRAYDAMYYIAQAFLEREGLSFSRHSATIAAFGQHFARTKRVPPSSTATSSKPLRHASRETMYHKRS